MDRTQLALLLAAILAVVLSSGCTDKTPERLRLATTTSTQNSGLLDELLPIFEANSGIRVQVLAVGTGQALALGSSGDVDVVLVHAREREDAFVEAGDGVDRREVMWNHFVILGPPSDPAGIRGELQAEEALHMIAKANARFVSRGDDSGTHIRERKLWGRAGLDPEQREFYLSAGLGMGKCLLIADEKRAYTLADRGTYLAFRNRVDLEVMVEGDAALRNPYGVIAVNPGRHTHVNHTAARAFIDFLVSPEGQRRISEYRIDGQALFHPAIGHK